jgi:menaquinone-dependent protoporphyrinogen IX oxidase
MTKTAIVYKTIYGSTKKYADWLGKDMKYKVFEMDKVKPKDLKPYSHLIVMSGTYAARMPLTKFLKSNWDSIKDKRITIVSVGMAPEDSFLTKVSKLFIPGKIKKKTKFMKIKGRMPDKGEPVKKSELKRVKDYLKSI